MNTFSGYPNHVPNLPLLVANANHPGQVPSNPYFRRVWFLTNLVRYLTTHVLRRIRFLTTLDRFLTTPNFVGGQEPIHPGQVPDTPGCVFVMAAEFLNITEITGMVNLTVRFFM